MGLDGVEIVMAWEEAFGVSISDGEASKLVTTRDAVDCICAKLGVGESSGACLGMITFHRVRKSLNEAADIPIRQIRLSSKLRHLLPQSDRERTWSEFQRVAGISNVRQPWGMSALLGGPQTVEDLVLELMSREATSQKGKKVWSRPQVREVIRAVIRDQIGLKRFSEDDEFVRDLGID